MGTSLEVLKLMLSELEYVLDCINQDKMPFDGDDFHEALRLGRKAVKECKNDGFRSCPYCGLLTKEIYGKV